MNIRIAKPNRTRKQKELMSILLRMHGEGKPVTARDLVTQISYGANYDAVRVSLRFLVEKGVLVKTGSGPKAVFEPTTRAYDLFRIMSV